MALQNFQPTKETAGLQVNVDVKRIDDNGFISFKSKSGLESFRRCRYLQ